MIQENDPRFMVRGNPQKPWEEQNWTEISRKIHNLQNQILLATQGNDYKSAYEYQLFIINDYDAKLLAVRTVAQKSSGKKTPGVDRKLALTDQERFDLAKNLTIDGTTYYIKRVLIPKPGDTEMRALGIPTIIDRAKQCLCKIALEPQFEAQFESNSFGFRPGRNAHDAIKRIQSHLVFHGPCYVLDTDISKCFDKIDHDQLLRRIGPPENIFVQQIRAWLKAGIFEPTEIIIPREGTPQGGVISPLLANIALDGVQDTLSQNVKKQFGWEEVTHLCYIRYADDLVILHPKETILNYAKTVLEWKLSLMNLELKQKKTRIVLTLKVEKDASGKIVKVHNEKFDFLGFSFAHRYLTKHIKWKTGGPFPQYRVIVRVSINRIRRHKASISAQMKKIGNIEKLIKELNPRIIGWSNYFQYSDAENYGDLPRKMDLWMNSKIRKWIRRNTRLRGKPEKFWKKDTKDWTLFYTQKDKTIIELKKYKDSFNWSLKDYTNVKGDFSPYKGDYDSYLAWRKSRLLGNDLID